MTDAHRIVMHVDMDAFYASVELRRHPELRGRPMFVGGAGRGVVLSASYEARAFGVRSGMPSSRARRLCPQAVVVRPDFDVYRTASDGVVEVFRSISPVVEVASIDEAFIDITGAVRMFGPPPVIGERVRALVADEQQITCSVGIGPTKFVAKLASNQAKPDGLSWVTPEEVVSFLHPLPVEAMWGVGASTAARLHRLGITLVGELAHLPASLLQKAFGPAQGSLLADLAWGRDARRVVATVPDRSIGCQETFSRDTDDPEVVVTELLRVASKTAHRMRQARLLGRTVVLSVRFADFTTISRSATLRGLTDETGTIYRCACDLFSRLGLQRARIRLVGVRVEGLVDRDRAYQQPSLDEPDKGWRDAEQAADAAVLKFGPAAVQRARLTRRSSVL
jgi:DNA polymerase-4